MEIKCGKTYTPVKKERMYPEELKGRAIELYMEGTSERTVGRLLKISKNMCLRWIRQKAKKIKPKDRSNERVEVIEREKTPIYIMTLVNRKTREILGYDIACDRSLQRIQNLVDNAPKAEFYFSDAFPVYSQICYDGVYRAIKNKSQTFTVESVNSDLRHYIPPLHRKSRCFFVLLILFSLSLKFLFLLSINFLLLNFVLIILNIILLFLRFYPVFSRQLYLGTLILSFLLTYFQQNI